MLQRKDKIAVILLFILLVLSSFAFDLLPGQFNVWYYGKRYNEVRVQNEIMVIPPSWRSKRTSHNFILWYPPERNSTFKGKEIKVDGFSILEERDTYVYADSIRGEQSISITSNYESGEKSVSYFMFLDTDLQKRESLNYQEAKRILATWR